MVDLIVENLAKPIAGLMLVVGLFRGDSAGSNPPAIAELRLISLRDSVYAEAIVRNGMTEEIVELMMNGTPITTSCRFTCHTVSRLWHRTIRYNPVTGQACVTSDSGECDSAFDVAALSSRFGRLHFAVADTGAARALRSRRAALAVSVSAKVDAYSLGEKSLWPREVSVAFTVPRLP